MENKSQRLNTTIKAVADILEKNKNNKSVKEAYADISKLKEKRNINQLYKEKKYGRVKWNN